jgi:hypothetical protein
VVGRTCQPKVFTETCKDKQTHTNSLAFSGIRDFKQHTLANCASRFVRGGGATVSLFRGLLSFISKDSSGHSKLETHPARQLVMHVVWELKNPQLHDSTAAQPSSQRPCVRTDEVMQAYHTRARQTLKRDSTVL